MIALNRLEDPRALVSVTRPDGEDVTFRITGRSLSDPELLIAEVRFGLGGLEYREQAIHETGLVARSGTIANRLMRLPREKLTPQKVAYA